MKEKTTQRSEKELKKASRSIVKDITMIYYCSFLFTCRRISTFSAFGVGGLFVMLLHVYVFPLQSVHNLVVWVSSLIVSCLCVQFMVIPHLEFIINRVIVGDLNTLKKNIHRLTLEEARNTCKQNQIL